MEECGCLWVEDNWGGIGGKKNFLRSLLCNTHVHPHPPFCLDSFMKDKVKAFTHIFPSWTSLQGLGHGGPKNIWVMPPKGEMSGKYSPGKFPYYEKGDRGDIFIREMTV